MRHHPDHTSHITEHHKDLKEDAIVSIEEISEKEGPLWVINGVLFHYTQIPDSVAPQTIRDYKRDEVTVCEEINTALSYTN